MSIQTEALEYTLDDAPFIGQIAYDDELNYPRATVLIAPTWRGCDALAQQQAQKIAELGYIGIAIDPYGQGKTGQNEMECTALMQPLIDNRNLLQNRMSQTFNIIRNLPNVDTDNIAAVGFCFGGLCVLDLARSGAQINAVISIHGLLNQSTDSKTSDIHSKILVLHGNDDPLAPPQDIQALINELNTANAEWEINLYGQTAHAFTNPEAKFPEKGLQFSPYANERAWNSTTHFLKELFL